MEFEHVGGAACLELVNSVPDRPDGGARDWLRDPETASCWMASLGLAPRRTPSRKELAALIALREAVYSTFSAVIDGETDAAGLQSIVDAHADGLRRHGYSQRDSRIERAWPERWTPDDLLAYFADSAMAELVGARLGRLKRCPSCDWLFFDLTRNGSRRWCSMEMCGGREKALRHYRKVRASRAS